MQPSAQGGRRIDRRNLFKLLSRIVGGFCAVYIASYTMLRLTGLFTMLGGVGLGRSGYQVEPGSWVPITRSTLPVWNTVTLVYQPCLSVELRIWVWARGRILES